MSLQICESLTTLKEYSCPVCQSVDSETIPYPSEKRFRKSICTHCGYLYHSRWLDPKSFFLFAKYYHKSPPNIFYYQNEISKASFFKPYMSGHVLADVSAGMGLCFKKLTQGSRFERVHAFEFSEAHAKWAKLHYKEYAETDFETFLRQLKSDHKIDTLLAHKWLSHIPQPDLYLKLFHSLLADDGTLLISSYILEKPYFETLRLRFPSEYFSLFSNDSMSLLLESCGFQIVERNFTNPFALFVCKKKTNPTALQSFNPDIQRMMWDQFQKGYEAVGKNKYEDLLKALPQCPDPNIMHLIQYSDDEHVLLAMAEKLYENFPKNNHVIKALADFWRRFGDLSKAKEYYESVLSSIKQFDTLVQYGHTLTHLGQYKAAAEVYTEAIEFNPSEIETLFKFIDSAYSKLRVN